MIYDLDLSDYEKTKVVKFSELKEDQFYWKLQCGTIKRVKYLKQVDKEKFNFIIYLDNEYYLNKDSYFCDNGFFDVPDCEYKNLYNRWFHSLTDASHYASSNEYKALMEKLNVDNDDLNWESYQI
jgi:hypothetical protein